MKKLIILLLTVCAITPLSAQVARGKVFVDANRNGVFDTGEKGIAHVAVSNGTEVVLTDNKGFYSIQAPENSIIFVIKPPEYQFYLDEFNLPQFYYKHYPEGGPKQKNPGILPTGPLPDDISFPLIPGKKEDGFKALIYGDTQVGNLEDLDFLGRDIIADLATSEAYTFATILGDIVHEVPSLYQPLNKIMSALKIPVYNVQGNHDMNYDAMSDRLATETFKLVYGPKNYAFNYGRVHFIVLDNILYSGDTIRYDYTEGFDEEALSFVMNDLKHVPADRLIVLMMHAPFINEYSMKPIVNTDKILAAIERFPHTFSISGHNHTVSQQFFGKESGWNGNSPHHHFNAGAVCGNWWNGAFDEYGIPDATMYDGTPNGYAILTFADNTYTVDYQVARRPASYQMNIYIPSVIRLNSNTGAANDVLVNFFTGSERDEVTIRFDNRQGFAMTRVLQTDPGYVGLYKRWESSQTAFYGRKPPEPQICSHLWKLLVPRDLTPGIHKAEVTATDLFGRKFKAFQFFRVEK